MGTDVHGTACMDAAPGVHPRLLRWQIVQGFPRVRIPILPNPRIDPTTIIRIICKGLVKGFFIMFQIPVQYRLDLFRHIRAVTPLVGRIAAQSTEAGRIILRHGAIICLYGNILSRNGGPAVNIHIAMRILDCHIACFIDDLAIYPDIRLQAGPQACTLTADGDAALCRCIGHLDIRCPAEASHRRRGIHTGTVVIHRTAARFDEGIIHLQIERAVIFNRNCRRAIRCHSSTNGKRI